MTLAKLPAFDRAVTVEPTDTPGTYLGTVDQSWSAPLGPNGGYLAAIAVRALEAGVDPAGERRLRSLTCHYLRRPAGGPIELRVESVRSGRRMATGALSGYQDGRVVLSAIAAFAVPDLESIGSWAPLPPDVVPAPADDAPVVPPARYRGDGWVGTDDHLPPLMQHLRLAPRMGGQLFSGRKLAPGEAPRSGGWIALAEPRPIDAAYVALCTDVWWPPSLEPLERPAGAPTIDLTIHFRADLPHDGLPPEPILGVYQSAAAAGGLVEEDGQLFLADGTLVAQSRQLALLVPIDG